MFRIFLSRIFQGPWIRAYLGCMVPVIVIFFPVLNGQILFHRDLAHWIFPARVMLRESILRGEWPFWSSMQALGFPLLADPLYGLFYPPNGLYLLVGPGWVATLLTLQALLHVLWGGLGIFLMARRFRGSPTAASVSALAWMLSGLIAAHASVGILLFADAWIPWHGVGMLALFDSLQNRRWMGGVVKAALPISFSFLLGEIFFALFGLAFGLVIFLAMVATEGVLKTSGRRSLWHGFKAVLFAWMLGTSIGAVVLIPAKISIAQTERRQMLTRELAEVCSFHPLRLLEMVLPGSMGDPDGAYPAFHTIGDRGLDGGPLTYGVYLGISVFALAMIGLNRRRPLSWWLFAFAVFSFLVAMGKYLPLHQLVRQLFFPLGYQRYPEKYLILSFTIFSLLAGMGVSRWPLGGAKKRLWILLGILVVLAMAAPWLFPLDWRPFILRAAIKSIVLLVVLQGILAIFSKQPQLGSYLLVLLVALDLLSAQLSSHVWLPRSVAADIPASAKVLKKDFARQDAHVLPRLYYAQRALTAVSRTRLKIPRQELEMRFAQTLLPNYSNAFGIASIPGYDVGISPLYAQFWTNHLSLGIPVLRLLSVDYVLLPSPEPGKPERSGLIPIWDPVAGSRLYRLQDPVPRVYLVGETVPMSDSEAMETLITPAVVWGEKAVVSNETPSKRLSDPGRGGTCRILHYQPNHIQATCHANRESLAVFVEQFSPGWTATVDGLPTTLIRANLFMRGVPIASGPHVIDMVYRPQGFWLGLTISLLGVLSLAVFAFLNRWQKPNSPAKDHGTSL